MASDGNHLATPEDFCRAAAASRPEPERVVLPKLGKPVLLRRPTPMWFLFHGQLPTSLAARLQAGQVGVETVEDLRALAEWMVPLLEEVFVEPRLSLHPGPGEISPDWLHVEDANFVIRWAVGEVADEDRDLASFRGDA